MRHSHLVNSSALFVFVIALISLPDESPSLAYVACTWEKSDPSGLAHPAVHASAVRLWAAETGKAAADRARE